MDGMGGGRGGLPYPATVPLIFQEVVEIARMVVPPTYGSLQQQRTQARGFYADDLVEMTKKEIASLNANNVG